MTAVISVYIKKKSKFVNKKNYYYYLFLERGREKEGEKYQWVVAFHTPPTGDLACNPGMCPRLGIKPTTLWFTGWHRIHWASPARAKIGEFLCSHFNIKDGRKYATLWRIMLYFKKCKHATKMQKKDLCSVWRRCCDWSNVVKVVCKVSWYNGYYWHFAQITLCWGAVLRIGRCLAAALASTY